MHTHTHRGGKGWQIMHRLALANYSEGFRSTHKLCRKMAF